MPRTTLKVGTTAHAQAVDITAQVQAFVGQSGLQEGWCTVYVPHTTAGVAVNEAADPYVIHDILNTLDKLIPWRGDYRHAEGNSAAHLKSVLVGSSVRLPVSGGGLDLGTWQGVFFMEFNGPRKRKALVDVC